METSVEIAQSFILPKIYQCLGWCFPVEITTVRDRHNYTAVSDPNTGIDHTFYHTTDDEEKLLQYHCSIISHIFLCVDDQPCIHLEGLA